MTLDDLAQLTGEWLRGVGPMSDVVISSRVRLARNLADYPFLATAGDHERAEIYRTLAERIAATPGGTDALLVDVETTDPIDRQFLVERHLISRQHAAGEGHRGVSISPSETRALMINEEDHLRIQVLRSGLQLQALWEEVNEVDDALGASLPFAFDRQFGYLTACPTNVGTGIRVSVMLHLPALRLTNEFERVGQAAKDMKLAVRGLFGEGTEALGDFFQVSNQITLGREETDIIDDFHHVVIPKIVEYEQAARAALLEKRLHALDDKLFRAMGTLRSARLMSSNEAMQYLSHVRMGLHTGRIKSVDLQTVNELFIQTQPAHLQFLQGERLSGEQRSIARANLIRARLSQN